MEFIAGIGLNLNSRDDLLLGLLKLVPFSDYSYVKLQFGLSDKKNQINFFDETKLKLLLKSCDDSLGNDIAFLAIARGAKSADNHFIIDQIDSSARDHALSSNQEEFFELVKIRKNLNILSSDQ